MAFRRYPQFSWEPSHVLMLPSQGDVVDTINYRRYPQFTFERCHVDDLPRGVVSSTTGSPWTTYAQMRRQ